MGAIGGRHVALLGAILVSIGAMGAAMHDWSEILKPSFVFGALGVVGTNLAALYMERPNEKPQEPGPDRQPALKYGKRER